MRLQSCLMVLALFGSSSVAMAQEPSWGIKGGVNFASQQSPDDPEATDLKNRVGIIAGAFVTWPVGARFSIQPEVLYSQKGAKFEVPGLVKGALEVDYLEVPVLLRYGTAASGRSSVQFFGGPSLGFRVSANAKAEAGGESESQDVSEFVESFDFGVVVGAGAEVGRLTVDGRYTWGLSNINADESDPTKVRNRVFSILAGVRF